MKLAFRHKLWTKLPTASPERMGLVGAIVMFLSVGLVYIWMLPPLHPIDEARHMGYAMAIAEGRIPHVLEPINLERLGLSRIRGTNIQAAAAHPPLYHALIAFPLKISIEAGNLAMGIRLARGISLLFGALSLVYAFRLLRRVFSSYPHVAIGGTAIVATLPLYVYSCSIAYSDALSALCCMAALDAALGIVFLGFSPRRYGLCAFWVALASLSRLMSLLVAIGAIAAVGMAALVDSSRKPWSRLARSVLHSAGLVLVAALSGGWFYLRNYLRYGDVSASSVLLDKLDRQPRTLLKALLSPRWLDLFEHYWSKIVGGITLPGTSAVFARALLCVALVGLVWIAIGSRRKMSNAVPLQTWVARGAVALSAAAVVGPMFLFHAKGGNFTPRYAMPVAWLQFGLVAFALSWPQRPWLLQSAVAMCVFMQLLTVELYALSLYASIPLVRPDVVARNVEDFKSVLGMGTQGVSYPDNFYLLSLLGVAIGTWLVLESLGSTYRRCGSRVP